MLAEVGILDNEAEEEDEESTPVSPQSRTTTPADTPGVVAPEASPFINSPTDVSVLVIGSYAIETLVPHVLQDCYREIQFYC